ncbi:hypothetical protein B7R22_09250 [Subtercola boreus]|uniref:DUF6745 domain-containing protein n=1 Tax=Subtercola boreus TaxID=120213 RepID=A0A3E0VXU3_9MICO|nr:hypothetical protein [Subtercola boreus]RFA14415.1 hypothetical protein B7R22_09250 [Subtercola boreus]
MESSNYRREEERSLLDEWRHDADSTQPIDRLRAEAAILACYRELAIAPPRYIVWAASPLASARALALVQDVVAAAVRLRLASDRFDSVDSLDPCLVRRFEHLSPGLAEDVIGQLLTQGVDQATPLPLERRWQVHSGLWEQLLGPAHETGSGGIAALVGWAFLADARSSNQCVVEQLDADVDGAETRYEPYERDFLVDSHIAQALELLTGADLSRWRPFVELGRHSFWSWLRRGYVVMSDRPTVLNLDEQGRPHCLTGAAIAWADGWQVHAVHGSRTDPA